MPRTPAPLTVDMLSLSFQESFRRLISMLTYLNA
jgi:hypothetical protein